MARCRDCDVCGYHEPSVKFNTKYCVFLCGKCLRKREEKDEKEN